MAMIMVMMMLVSASSKEPPSDLLFLRQMWLVEGWCCARSPHPESPHHTTHGPDSVYMYTPGTLTWQRICSKYGFRVPSAFHPCAIRMPSTCHLRISSGLPHSFPCHASYTFERSICHLRKWQMSMGSVSQDLKVDTSVPQWSFMEALWVVLSNLVL